MIITDLKAAVAAAETFLERAAQCKPGIYGSVEYGKDAAALKRASLELTNALVKIRR
jgi:hypothetical protein